MAEIFEVFMVVLFGLSWPLNIIKSIKSRTAKGRSIFFVICIMVGYLCGIVSKIFADKITYVFIFYCINLVMVGVDLGFLLRNIKLDQMENIKHNKNRKEMEKFSN
ncbi:MAG: hypothetical protein PHD85_03870 [Bacilli bacterium]|jgi:hypothetical protein|nr:hypothetical protein [Bacilli bacterium]MDD3348772.1 hypothetical protein [Bacilli bacterium]